MKKTTQLRSIIDSQHLDFLMEAHNALSAKIVEEAGFKGIWASGLSMSAAMGVRDNNEASWTQVLEVLEFMSDATKIPILLDGDTGYGNFNNARRLVKKLEQRRIAGVCIEDKLFPKTNSFIKGEAQPLADIEEFCGKIKAMKDSQNDEDFVVVSRVEAFIAGWGLQEALKRAEAYRMAGSDAILIHSKKADSSEIEQFIKEWGNRLPVIIVPTKYFEVPTSLYRELEVSTVIWANHNLRASISAMQRVSKQIFQDESLINIEKKVASVDEIFELQDAKELSASEKKYLPNSNKGNSVVIIGHAKKENSMLEKQIEIINSEGIKEIIVAHYKEMNHAALLYRVSESIRENTIISSDEIIYKPYVLEELMNNQSDIAIVIDADIQKYSDKNDYITAKEPYSKLLYDQTTELQSIGNINKNSVHGEFIGLWKVSKKGADIVKQALHELAKRKDFEQLTIVDLLRYISITKPIAVMYIKGLWLDYPAYKELQKAGEMK